MNISRVWAMPNSDTFSVPPIGEFVKKYLAKSNTVGMGKKRGFEIAEILMVCHGGQHNDTICMAEKRIV